MKNKRIAIVGTRGIPNLYGGFEQFAEYVSVGLVEKGYEVTVYNPHFHPYAESSFNGVTISRKWCPEKKLGPAAHIIYDYLCLKDALKRKNDVILELGYQSAAISMLLCPINKTRLITNMDGLEWKRQKWSKNVQRFTLWAEKIGAKKSHALVADNPGIQDYLRETYGKESSMIPYGAVVFEQPDSSVLGAYGLIENGYYLLIARMEPENNVETVLDGYVKSGSEKPFVVVGNVTTEYGYHIQSKYSNTNIRFTGGVYDIGVLNNLRYYAQIYFHGHSVGGTNPSLLEAMASHAMIVSHNNVFNKSVLGDDALYFDCVEDVAGVIERDDLISTHRQSFINNNLDKIRKIYKWDLIVQQYADLFERVINESRNNNAG